MDEAPKNGHHTGYYRDPQGRDRSADTSPSKRQALKWATDEEAKIRAGRWHDPDAGSMTFTEYFEKEWINERTLEVRTRDGYWSHYNTSLKAEFGTMSLSAIHGPQIQRWVNRMEKAGVSPSVIRGRYKCLQTVLAARRGVSAMNDGKITEDPCWMITLPVVPERMVQVYTPGQVDALLEKLPEWWRRMVWLDSETGMRWGELIALRDDGFEFLRRRLDGPAHHRRNRQGQHRQRHPVLGQALPKGKKPRIVGVPAETCDMVSAHMKARGLKGDDLLFPMPVKTRDANGRVTFVWEVDRTEVWPEGLPVSATTLRLSGAVRSSR